MSTLQFPANPAVGDTYDWDAYKYVWDGEKWKTVGIGYNPVNDLRDELEPRISNNESKVFEALRYMQSGEQPTFDAALATAIGGYPKGAMVLGNDGVTLWQSKVDSNSTNPNTDPSDWGTFDIGLKADLAMPSGAGLVGGLPVFVTATKYAGGATTSSTNNDAAIIAAINDAIATGNFVYWPSVYEVQGPIPNLHSVRHMGPGGIKRGSETLYVDRDDVVCKLFASVGGHASGDGLTADYPLTMDAAVLAAQARVICNRNARTWVYLADGVYPPLAVASRWKIGGMRWFTKLIGSSPSACTVDASAPSISLFDVKGAGAKFWLENIHLAHTRGASITGSEGAIVQLVNCDQTDCYYGFTGNSHSEIYMSGGTHRFTSGFSGYSIVRSMFLVKHSIGYKYDEDLGYAVADPKGSCPKFYGEGLGRGMIGQEHSTGHVRLDVIDKFSKGIELVSSSRAHLENTLKVTRCGVAAEVENGCNIYDAGVDWTTRGTGKNSVSIRYLGGVRMAETSTQGSIRQRLGFKDVTGTTITDTVATPIGLDFPTDGVSNNNGCTFTVTLTGTITGVLGKKDFALQHSSGFCGRVVFHSTAQGPFRLEIGFIKTDGDFILPVGLGVAGGFSGDAGVGESGASAAPINRIIDSGPGTLDVLAFVEIAGDSISLNAATLHFEG